jgi:hypothetical protein
MRSVALIILAALAVACQPIEPAPADTAPAPAAPVASPQELKLGCAAPFGADATGASLASVFGAENLVAEKQPATDGITLDIVAIYPNDPKKRIAVQFQNVEARTGLISAEVKNLESQWVGPGDIQTGENIQAVEAANGAPFELHGFGWDYGGYVADWKGGKLAAPAPKCRTLMRFESSSSDPAVVGDGPPKASNLPAMQAAAPRVVSFGIAWETPPPQ